MPWKKLQGGKKIDLLSGLAGNNSKKVGCRKALMLKNGRNKKRPAGRSHEVYGCT